jgi:hypothetical protein
MSEAANVEAPAASAATVVKGMKKNGTPNPSTVQYSEARQTDHITRQAVARQQGALPPSRKPDIVGEAHRGAESARSKQGQGEGAEGREGV